MKANDLRILVPIKQVPRTEEITLDATGRLVRTGVDLGINAFCRRSIAKAVHLANEFGGSVTAVSMGPQTATSALREALAAGVDEGFLLSDPALAGSDTLVTARVLARFAVEHGPFTMILVGRFSIDAGTGQVGPQLAELLGLPFIGAATSLELDGDYVSSRCELDSSVREVVVELPAVIAVAERLCAPAKPSLAEVHAVDTEKIKILDTDRLRVDFPVGAAGSPTSVSGITRIAQLRRGLSWSGSIEEQVAKLAVFLADRDPIPAEQRSIASGSLSSVAILCDHEQPDLTADLIALTRELVASEGLQITAVGFPDSYRGLAIGDSIVELRGSRHEADVAAALRPWISESRPELLVAPATSFGREVAARLAASLGVGLIGDATELEIRDDARVIAYKPVGSELSMAAVLTRSEIQLVTMKLSRSLHTGALPPTTPTTIQPQILQVPRRVNIHTVHNEITEDLRALDEAEIVIGVGLGVDPADYPLVFEQAARVRAAVACTRKVADRGWMPRSRQIGVTGRSIAPLLYIAVGVRGSFNHLVGVNRARTILGINNDPESPLAAAADAAITADWRVALPRVVDAVLASVAE